MSEDDDRDDLEAPEPHEPIIMTFETSLNGSNEPNGPGEAEAGADVPERRRRDGERVERRRAATPGDRRVDARSARRRRRTEADVEEDERGDRAERPLVDGARR